MNTTPVSLLQRLRQPDQPDAWSRFVDLYTPLLYQWTRCRGLQAQEAADLVQEVFLILVEKLPAFEYDSRKSFRRWLNTVILNKWRETCRRRANQPRTAGAALLEDVPGDDDIEILTEEEYRRHLTTRALDLMKRDFKEATCKAFWEYVVRDRPVEEVATELGLTTNQVYLAKGRVLTRLREELEGLLD